MEPWNLLYLVRHGENLANLTLEFSHRKVDHPLTPKGVLQAEQTAACLQAKGVQEIYASPLRRAVQTAQIIGAALGLPVTVVEEFREMNVGDLEGQKPTAALWKQHDAIIQAWEDGSPETRFPGGENYHELLARALAGLRSVLRGKSGRAILVVGHGGQLSTSIRNVCPNLDPEILNRGMGNCSITVLRARLAGETIAAELVGFADSSHLSADAAKWEPAELE